MFMSPAKTTTTARTVLTVALAVGLASAVPALTLHASAQAQTFTDSGDLTFAYPGGGLPGEGRPPAPGPTDPDGAY
jgi:hypothetical protein